MSCDPVEQSVHIVAQDFRFTPAEVHVSAEQPIRLTIVNEGREPHEFKSPLLAHQIGATNGVSSSLPVLPHQKAETVIRTIPGVYLFYCASAATREWAARLLWTREPSRTGGSSCEEALKVCG